MKKYIQRMLSLAGQAGRKEMLGVVFLAISMGVIATALSWVLTFAALSSSRAIWETLALYSLSVLFLLGKIFFLFGAARRLRHIGLNPWWSALLIVFNFIPYGWTAAAVTALLLLILPPFLNEKQEEAVPSYLLSNAVLLAVSALFICGAWWTLNAQKRKTPDVFQNAPVLEKQLNAIEQTLQNSTGLGVYAPRTDSLADEIMWNDKADSCGPRCWQYLAQNGGQALRVKRVSPTQLKRRSRAADAGRTPKDEVRQLWTFRQQLFDAKNILREDVFFNAEGKVQMIRRHHPDGTHREWILFSDDGKIKHFQAVDAIAASAAGPMKKYEASDKDFTLSAPMGPREPERTYIQRAALIRPDGSFQFYRRNEDGSIRKGMSGSLAGEHEMKKPSPKHLAAFYQQSRSLPFWLQDSANKQ